MQFIDENNRLFIFQYRKTACKNADGKLYVYLNQKEGKQHRQSIGNDFGVFYGVFRLIFIYICIFQITHF